MTVFTSLAAEHMQISAQQGQQLMVWLRRVHANFGRFPNGSMKKMLRVAKANPVVIRLVDQLKCDHCKQVW